MLNLVIFGPPGAGKGTQAVLIAKKYKLAHLSSGELLRQELKNGALGKEIKKFQDAGRLVPDKLIIAMVEKAALNSKNKRGIIFDGYPRTLRQAKALNTFFKHQQADLNLVLNLRLSSQEAAKRILLRGKTSGRSDDNLTTVKSRFKVYNTETAPILDYYRQQKKMTTIDGRPEISKIFLAITKKLDKLK